MKYQVIENGVVANTVLADAPLADNWIQDDNAGPGWAYSDGVFTAPVVEVSSGIPQVVTMRQARLALLSAGLLSAVDAAIDAQVEPLKSAARIEWDYATEVRRDWPTLAMLSAAAGFTEAQLDQLFTAAAQL